MNATGAWLVWAYYVRDRIIPHNWGVVEPWMKKVRRRSPVLLDKLVQVKTPRPGLHVSS